MLRSTILCVKELRTSDKRLHVVHRSNDERNGDRAFSARARRSDDCSILALGQCFSERSRIFRGRRVSQSGKANRASILIHR
jgi:hypothetical protein